MRTPAHLLITYFHTIGAARLERLVIIFFVRRGVAGVALQHQMRAARLCLLWVVRTKAQARVSKTTASDTAQYLLVLPRG